MGQSRKAARNLARAFPENAAEANAIVQAAKNGVRIDGGGIYVTASPCWPCFRLIANAGLTRIVFGEFYRDQRIFDTSKTLGIELVDFSKQNK